MIGGFFFLKKDPYKRLFHNICAPKAWGGTYSTVSESPDPQQIYLNFVHNLGSYKECLILTDDLVLCLMLAYQMLTI